MHRTDLQPRQASNQVGWHRARQRLGQIARLPPGWNGANGAAPDHHTVDFAASQLTGLENAGAPAPTINPSPDGAIYAEWHMLGLDLELVFEAPGKIVALIEDQRGGIPAFDGDDPDLKHTLDALKVLCKR